MVTTTKAKYRNSLPQIEHKLFLTDGGLETTLIFHEGWDLPVAEAFILLDSEKGRKALAEYFDRYVALALRHRTGFILESPTWRANLDWGAKVGYDRARLANVNRRAIELMTEIRDRHETKDCPLRLHRAPRRRLRPWPHHERRGG